MDVLQQMFYSFALNYIKFIIICLKQYSVNCSQKKKIHTIYVLNLILPFQKLKQFIKVLIHFVILDQ